MEAGKILSCPRCSKRVAVKTQAPTVYSSCTCPVLIPDNNSDHYSQLKLVQPQHQQPQHGIGHLVVHLTNKLQGMGKTSRRGDHSAVSFNYPVEFPPSRRPTKRAMLCGVSYKSRKFELKGTVNDVKNMRELLMNKFGYPKEYIRVLTEEEPRQEFIPTKENMLSSLKWLVEDSHPGDSLVFFYSGHGLRKRDFDEDELDGFDETICPSDFSNTGMIVDNDLNSILVCPLKNGVKLHAIVDSCHSGTILDLPCVYDRKEKRWNNNRPPSGNYKSTAGGLAISIGACTDEQNAADSSTFTGKMDGVLTYLLVDLLKKFPGPTYGDLLDLMEETMDQVNRGGNLLKKLFSSKLSQTPLLSSSEEFNPYKTHIAL
ncbi:hypothetical protein SLEP1_g11055 [Rubroshorea leprosula]|uniref:Peptidase C14 caspase domain-containing protein n=1 Tax=Rubroshorea leprosula TaxID=152421 RepID=A0AAV5IFV2_9ROSI|nr:hypothetical protein SLEP1_g11055 [Rubroshorea leprosula]